MINILIVIVIIVYQINANTISLGYYLSTSRTFTTTTPRSIFTDPY